MTKNIAIVFPGQGSQSVGMLRSLAAAFPIVEQTFAQASAVLGYDLWRLTQDGPAEQLDLTTNTQPALLAASVAVWRIWQQQLGIRPRVMAGHSLGEYTALVCAQALEFEVAISLVAARGQFMQEAVPQGQGAMAAIVGLTNAQVEQLCAEAASGEVLAPANYNAHGQIVIAGTTPAILRAIELAKPYGAKLAMRLAVSVPSHCLLMESAAKRLATSLENIAIKTPEIPVLHNVDVKSYSTAAEIKLALNQQLYKPVRWVETMQAMAEQGIELAMECGPGNVLAGLNKRIEPKIPTLSIADVESLQAALEAIK